MTDTTLSQALKEAYANATGVTYSTLELRHSAFDQPIRVVRDRVDLTATLESDAPANAGETVLFKAYGFDLERPEVTSTGLPQCTIEIDNVDRVIVANIEAAMATTELVKVTYREYLDSDLTAPQNDPPLTMTILTITADVFRIKATAGFRNLNNYKFPRTAYDVDTFPGLAA